MHSGTRRCSTGNKFALFVVKMAERSSGIKLLTNYKRAIKVYNDKQD